MERLIAALDEDDTLASNVSMGEVVDASGLRKPGPLMPRPDELTPSQRAVAELLAFHEMPRFDAWALPNASWKMSRWLGLTPPGALERPVTFEHDGVRRTEPLWRAMHAHEADQPFAADAFFRGLNLPIAERLEAFGDITRGAYRIDRHRLTWGSHEEIGSEHGAWAAQMADALTAGGHGTTSMEIRWAVFLGLVRAGREIEQRWDWLLPAAEDSIEAMGECVRALPPERRDAALVAAVRSVSSGTSVVRTGLAMLETFPSATLTRLVYDNGHKAASAPKSSRIPRRALKSLLEEVGERQPIVAAALIRIRARLPVPALRQGHRREPKSADELTEVESEQLEHAGRLYDGETLSASARLDPNVEDTSFAGSLQIRTILDAGGSAAYDALLYRGDSGCVFRAGTLDVVAEVIQVTVECPDAGLRDALRSVLL